MNEENCNDKLSALTRLEKINASLVETVNRLKVQIAVSQNYDQLTEIVTHLNLLLPIFDAADMLSSITDLRNDITSREKEIR